MKDASYELSYIQASLEELDAYLLSKEVFWPVATPSPLRLFPKLTIGNLLLSLNKLEGYSSGRQLATVQRSAFTQLKRDVEGYSRRWAVAWKTKAAHEFQSRLRQWTHYLNDLEQKIEAHAPFFSTEVRNRVLLELLREFSSQDSQTALDQLDAAFRGWFTPADFIWDPLIQSAFPKETFWFLYGMIAE
jgi:hypothetical protein